MLEVGCGNGINLILLAGRLPEISFTGIELTAAGHQAARRLQEQSELPPAMRAFAPLPLADPAAFRGIGFRQGNATGLPFADGEFDLVITVLSLEQMERVRQQALARDRPRHAPAQPDDRAVSRRQRGLLAAAERAAAQLLPGPDRGPSRLSGCEPVLALDDYPQEVFLKTCAVLSERRPA